MRSGLVVFELQGRSCAFHPALLSYRRMVIPLEIGRRPLMSQVTPTTCLDELKTQILDRASAPSVSQSARSVS